MSPSRKLTAFRIDAHLLARLEKAAVEDDRAVSYQIRKAVEFWLDARKAGSARPEDKRVAIRKRSSTA